jgi:type IV pilus assembly protein PilV
MPAGRPHPSDTLARVLPAQRGVMLVEALIGVLLFSIGILAVIAMQSVAIREIGVSKMRADASYIADRVIGDLASGNIAALADGDTTYDATSNPTHVWARAVVDPRTGLPGGRLRVIKAGVAVTVIVSWQTQDGAHTFSQTANLVDS